MTLVFVTGNANKFASAEKQLTQFGIQLTQKELEIIEPQEENIEKVALFKVQQAFEKIQSPTVVADTGWNIPTLKGFPGPFMHYISEWFTADDFLNLMKGKEDRTIIIENVVAFQSNNQIKTFRTERIGTVLTRKHGDGVAIDQISTFRHDKKTIADCRAEGSSPYDATDFKSVWEVFGEWYEQEFI